MLSILYKDILCPLLMAFVINLCNITIQHATLRIQMIAETSDNLFEHVLSSLEG